ncbi:hypothetical protein [Halobacillus salinus]|uniref:hypothetical protein n=1 Tax=Halobacillus salinus TaxID=192814 RepID=UPI0015914ABA|nr:hypothetical protein [Halobacillus salinus]
MRIMLAIEKGVYQARRAPQFDLLRANHAMMNRIPAHDAMAMTCTDWAVTPITGARVATCPEKLVITMRMTTPVSDRTPVRFEESLSLIARNTTYKSEATKVISQMIPGLESRTTLANGKLPL